MVGVADHSKNADDLVGLVTWALGENLDPASFLYGRIDPSRIGSSGHSAGGLASLVATARDQRIRAASSFDPVDNAALGVAAMPSITVPVAINYSEDSSCNANGSSRVLYAAGVPVKRGMKIVTGTHCDPLDPANPLCSIVCGSIDAARQLLYRRYVTGWFEYWLRCDPTYYEWVYGTKVQDDVTAGKVTFEAVPDPAVRRRCRGPSRRRPPCHPGPRELSTCHRERSHRRGRGDLASPRELTAHTRRGRSASAAPL